MLFRSLDYDVFFKMVNYFVTNDYRNALLLLDDVIRKGFDPLHFLDGLSHHFRNLLVGKDASTLTLLDVSDATRQQYQQQSEKIGVDFLLEAINTVSTCELEFRQARDKRQHVEFCLLNLCCLTGEKKK